MTGLQSRIVPPSEYDRDLLTALRRAEKRIGELELDKRAMFTELDNCYARIGELEAERDEERGRAEQAEAFMGDAVVRCERAEARLALPSSRPGRGGGDTEETRSSQTHERLG